MDCELRYDSRPRAPLTIFRSSVNKTNPSENQTFSTHQPQEYPRAAVYKIEQKSYLSTYWVTEPMLLAKAFLELGN